MSKPIDSFRGPYRFLSNFYNVHVLYEGEFYPTSEHAFQAAKTTDLTIRRYIAGIPTARAAKRAGSRRGGVLTLREDWEDVKYEVMREIVWDKFHRHPLLKDALLRTGDTELIEGNEWGDRVWGKCRGEGKNWLGMILMDVRAALRVKNGS